MSPRRHRRRSSSCSSAARAPPRSPSSRRSSRPSSPPAPPPTMTPLSSPAVTLPPSSSSPRWDDAIDALFFIWRRRLRGDHCLVPMLEKWHCARERRQELWSDKVERMKDLFLEHVGGIIDGAEVAICKEKVHKLNNEIMRCKSLISQPQKMPNSLRLLEEKKSLEPETMPEKMAIPCRIALGAAWVRIHSRVLRECQRLSDGLPIYSFRGMILRNIKSKSACKASIEMDTIRKGILGKAFSLIDTYDDFGRTASAHGLSSHSASHDAFDDVEPFSSADAPISLRREMTSLKGLQPIAEMPVCSGPKVQPLKPLHLFRARHIHGMLRLISTRGKVF